MFKSVQRFDEQKTLFWNLFQLNSVTFLNNSIKIVEFSIFETFIA
tara:strand:+ start:118 stop:252 length:135 start_codon:yes stop_codon:yes gene_type:complete